MRRSSTKRPTINSAKKRNQDCKLRRIIRTSKPPKSQLRALSAKKRKRSKRFSRLLIRRPKTTRSPSMPSRKSCLLTRRSRKWWSRSTWRSRRPRRIWSSNWRPRRRRLPSSKELTKRRARPRSRSLKCQKPPPTEVPLTSTYKASQAPQPPPRPPTCPSTWRSPLRTDRFRMWSRWLTQITSHRPRSRPSSCLPWKCPSPNKAKKTQLELDSTSKISRILLPSRNER